MEEKIKEIIKNLQEHYSAKAFDIIARDLSEALKTEKEEEIDNTYSTYELRNCSKEFSDFLQQNVRAEYSIYDVAKAVEDSEEELSEAIKREFDTLQKAMTEENAEVLLLTKTGN